ncbi:MAG: prolyl oligopeptidase family serine peptidase [Actinomycetota bacterium]
MTATDPADTFPRQHARTRRFTLGAPRTVTITDAGLVRFCRSRSGDDPVNLLWELDPATGVERVVIDPTTLAVDESDLPAAERARRERAREAAGGVVTYAAEEDRIVTALAGQLVVADRVDGEWTVTTVPTDGPVFDPRPVGEEIAFVSGDSLRLGDRVLCEEDGETVSWGSAEFVAAEEMGRGRGYWVEPGGQRLLVTRVDVAPVPVWWIGDPAEPSSEPHPVRYPRAGADNAEVRLFVVDAATGERTEVDWDRERFEYLADAGWRSAGEPWMVVQSRDQRAVVVLDIDPSTGATSGRRRITDDAWVELVPGSPAFDGDHLVTVEDVGAARRVCVDGEPVTGDELQVRSIVAVEDGVIWCTASTEPTEVDLWRIAGDVAVRITDGGGVHGATVGGDTVVVTAASLDRDGTAVTVRRDGAVVASVDSFAETPLLTPAPALLRAGERELRTAVLLPHDADPDAKLPVLLDPYGGPHAQRVLASRAAFAASQWFADQGFAVVVADGRGTPARGPAWERAVHGDLAAPVLDDQIDALHAAAEHDVRLDLDRVAIRGWSFGGYLAALAVLRRPDVFHAAIAGAPVTDWALYDTHYTERYLGRPDTAPDAYERTSLLVDAHRLDRPLLVVHGLADDNVVAAHTLQLSRALLEAGRPHEVLPLSGVTHMTPQEVVAENLLLVQLAFLRRVLHLGGGGLASSGPGADQR